MNNKVLFLGSGSPFMVTAVMGNLSKSGYDVFSVAADVASVRTYGADHDIVVLFLGEALLEKHVDVLKAIGVNDEMVHGTIRFTVGDFTTKEDIDYTVECLTEVINKLRELSPVNDAKGW